MALSGNCSEQVVVSILDERDRNTVQASEWLTAFGYAFTKNTLATIADKGQVRGLNRHGRGDIWPHSVLMREVRHEPNWLKTAKKPPTHKGFVTLREAVTEFPVSITRLLEAIKEGELNCELKSYKSIPVFNLSRKGLEARFPVQEISAPATTTSSVANVEKEVQVATQGGTKSGPVRTDRVISLKSAVVLLQKAGLDIVHNQLYKLGVKDGKFECLRMGREYRVRQSLVDAWISKPPQWILDCAVTAVSPPGFVTTRQIVVENAFDYDRLKHLVEVGILPVTPLKADAKGKGRQHLVAEDDYILLLDDEQLKNYLSCNIDLNMNELSAMARRKSKSRSSKPKAEKPEARQAASVVEQSPKITFADCSAAYVEAKRFLSRINREKARSEELVETFDRAINEEWSNDRIVEAVSKLIG